MEFHHKKLPLWVSRPTDPPSQCNRRRQPHSVSKDRLITLYVASVSDINCPASNTRRRESVVATEDGSVDVWLAPAASTSAERIQWVADPPSWIRQMEAEVLDEEVEEAESAALSPSVRPPMWLQCVDRSQIHYEQVSYSTTEY